MTSRRTRRLRRCSVCGRVTMRDHTCVPAVAFGLAVALGLALAVLADRPNRDANRDRNRDNRDGKRDEPRNNEGISR